MKIRWTPLLLLALAAACGKAGEDPERVTLGAEAGEVRSRLPAAIQIELDSGNVAYRERDFEGALRHYQAALRLDPDEPTSWYGVAMAAGALGDQALLAEARGKVEQLAPQMDPGTHSMPGRGAHPPLPGAPPR